MALGGIIDVLLYGCLELNREDCVYFPAMQLKEWKK